ncbi:MAG: SoxR reducing system RseC family protein [Tannerellaceae bacterium]
MNESINHSGIIERIEGNQIFVRIVQQSACAGCHAQSMCTASESKEKVIEVTDYSGTYQVGEQVFICGQSSVGLQAVLLAFVVPLILMVAVLVAGSELGWSEPVSGLSGLLFLFPYYCLLYALRKRLKKRFVFTLKKHN